MELIKTNLGWIGLGLFIITFLVGCGVRETVPYIDEMKDKIKRMRVAQTIWLSGLVILITGMVLQFSL